MHIIIIYGQTTQNSISAYQNDDHNFWREEGNERDCGVHRSSWERRSGAGNSLRRWVLRRKDLAAICRASNGLSCEFSVVSRTLNEQYYSGRRWPQRSCMNTLNSRVSDKLRFLTCIYFIFTILFNTRWTLYYIKLKNYI